MPEFALVTVPKPFVGEIGRLQRNAIGSWTRLQPRPEIVLVGNDEGVAEAAAELGVAHEPAVETTRAGTPLLPSVLRAAAADLCAYVNADIVLFDDFTRAAARVAARERFLLVGRRTDLDVDDAFAFGAGWQEELRGRVELHGELHAESGIDYFVFRPGLWDDVPPFAIGRFAWDGWLLWAAHRTGAAVIDATRAVLAVHQNHGYPGAPTPDGEGDWHEEIRRNLELAGEVPASFTVLDAAFLMLRDGRVVPALTPRHVLRRVHRLRVRAA
jgi:hypothetical protein